MCPEKISKAHMSEERGRPDARKGLAFARNGRGAMHLVFAAQREQQVGLKRDPCTNQSAASQDDH